VSVLASFLAVAQAATPGPSATPFEVDVVGDEVSGWKEWLPLLGPLVGALVGGLGGVLVGGRIQHELEDKRQDRSEYADKRRAIAALRLARRHLSAIRINTAIAAQTRVRWPLYNGLESPLRIEEEQLIAAWVTHEAWATYTEVISHASLFALFPDSEEDQAKEADDEWLAGVDELFDQAGAAIDALRSEHTRLATEINSPDAAYEWEPLVPKSWEPFAPEAGDEDEPRGNEAQ
jgi:hypothetical protein